MLTNAIKFQTEGEIRVNVNRNISSSIVKISVADQGRGMSNREILRVFDGKYTNRDETLNPKGRGIGLAISKAICDKLGGSITVQSKLDVGSTFTFTMGIFESLSSEIMREEIETFNSLASRLTKQEPNSMKEIRSASPHHA